MRNAFWALVGVVSVVLLVVLPNWAEADQSATKGWPAVYLSALGEPIHRTTVIADAGVPRDNLSTDGGASVTYTWTGNEHVCLEATGEFCFEVGTAASMTAACAKAVVVPANTERCFFLRYGQTAISVSALTGATTVKMFETRYP